MWMKPESIRAAYTQYGVDRYYQEHGDTYQNPHEEALQAALTTAVGLWRPNLTRVMDLACGSGEATIALEKLGAQEILGVDPYTAKAYKVRTGRDVLPYNFREIADSWYLGLFNYYTTIVCSYALHLVEPSRLPALALKLANLSPTLIVVTPHKRPHLKPEWGWLLDGFHTEQRVKVRKYSSKLIP